MIYHVVMHIKCEFDYEEPELSNILEELTEFPEGVEVYRADCMLIVKEAP